MVSTAGHSACMMFLLLCWGSHPAALLRCSSPAQDHLTSSSPLGPCTAAFGQSTSCKLAWNSLTARLMPLSVFTRTCFQCSLDRRAGLMFSNWRTAWHRMANSVHITGEKKFAASLILVAIGSQQGRLEQKPKSCLP